MIDPGTISGVLSLLSGSGLDLSSIMDRLLGMQAGGGIVDPEEMDKIRLEVKTIGVALTAGAAELESRTRHLKMQVDERDRLHTSAHESYNELVEAMRRRKERELQE